MTRMCAAIFVSSLVVAGRVASAQPIPPPGPTPGPTPRFPIARDVPLLPDLPMVPPVPAPPLVALPPLPFLPDFAYQPAPRPQPTPRPRGDGARNSDGGYDQARELIDSGRYERALEALDRVAAAPNSTRADAAL